MALGLLCRVRAWNRIQFSRTQRRDSGSQVLLIARPIRQRAGTADAPRGGYLRLALGVGTLTLPPVMPTFTQDDGRFCFSAELFIVFRSAPPLLETPFESVIW